MAMLIGDSSGLITNPIAGDARGNTECCAFRNQETESATKSKQLGSAVITQIGDRRRSVLNQEAL